MKRSYFPAAVVLASAGALVACGAQVGPQYPGEPLATFTGAVVTNQATGSVPAMDAALVWDYGQDVPGHSYQRNVSVRVPVSGTFPASFTLDVYDPPPAGGPALIVDRGRGTTCTANGLFVATIAAVRSGTPDGEIAESEVLGVDRYHGVVYLDHDAAPSDECMAFTARFLHIDPRRGYHLVKLGAGDAYGPGLPVDNPQGLADPLTIVIGSVGTTSEAGTSDAGASDARTWDAETDSAAPYPDASDNDAAAPAVDAAAGD